VRDRGSVTIHAVTVTVVLVLLTLVVVQATSLVRMRHRVAAAADLAALAATQASVRGEDGCAAARVIARRNGAVLVRCRMDYDVATVTARARSAPWWGDRWAVEQRARAAPESYVKDQAAGASARNASSSRIAPALSSGSLPLPHLGE
jgi:secretion/DNA translocation related TadE-like protein